MPHDVVVDVIVPTVPVVDVAALGVQGPPGEPGEPGPAGPPGPQGEPGDAAGPHAATHQTGGIDPITALDAGVLTGTVTTNVLAPLVTATSAVVVGATPAQSGALRLGNNLAIVARNVGNTADIAALKVAADDAIYLGSDGATHLTGNTYVDGRLVMYFPGKIELAENAPPAVPGATIGILFMDNNGAGKSRLMIQFATGAPVQIAIQP